MSRFSELASLLFKQWRWLCAVLLFVYGGVCMASPPSWTWERGLELEKEQVYQADVAVGSVQKKLEFRWTLYKNHGLVMHIRYDGFNHQEVLYTDYQRNAFKIALGKGEAREKYAPSLVLYFKDFKDKKAYFKLYIDGSAMIVGESLSPSDEQIKQARSDAQNQEQTEGR